MQKADEDTIQRIGIPSLVLMERAALKTVEVMKERQIALEQCLVVCGSGNNGGDGFAVARLLHMEGKRVCAVFVGSEASMSEECRMQREIAGNLGVQIVTDSSTGRIYCCDRCGVWCGSEPSGYRAIC